ncbi:hypothetical protein B296_00020920 [Ensete ventricosum]|uniref:Uncharacterized protein n=1 Tax=Ensete ventricosum TaxID=4639 RepID=A0A426XLQ1_ENSVE|nr:hypothetical protein B296_00020920 [Ensete ventricosum]
MAGACRAAPVDVGSTRKVDTPFGDGASLQGSRLRAQHPQELPSEGSSACHKVGCTKMSVRSQSPLGVCRRLPTHVSRELRDSLGK